MKCYKKAIEVRITIYIVHGKGLINNNGTMSLKLRRWTSAALHSATSMQACSEQGADEGGVRVLPPR